VNPKFAIRQMTQEDLPQVKQIISLSFGRFFRFFASSSLEGLEGQALVCEVQQTILGFVKLVDFQVGENKCGCILWIAVHPEFRRKGIASALTLDSVRRLKQTGSKMIFASVNRRNVASLKVLSKHDFDRMGFLDLWRLFGWRVFELYGDIWYAPGEIVLMLE
jgi:ribosomal protein S18 acetylase RimI-like enzyme